MKVHVYDQNGKVSADKELGTFLDEVKVNPSLIHEAVVRQLANARNPIAHTKTKGEVRGGGRKPYRQKGTGNARQGSIRNPHYVGGGVAFGPRNTRNFTKDMNRKQRKLALYGAIKSKVQEESLFGFTGYEGEAKTKAFAEVLAKLPQGRSYLFFTHGPVESFALAARNMPNVEVKDITRLNIHDLMRFDKVFFVSSALEEFGKIFLPTKN